MKREKKDEPPKKKTNGRDIQITELFMARNRKRGWTQCFHGVIYREKDENGNQTAVNGNIYLPGEGKYWSRDSDQWKYGDNIDDILELRMEHNIHADPGKFSWILNQKYFHN